MPLGIQDFESHLRITSHFHFHLTNIERPRPCVHARYCAPGHGRQALAHEPVGFARKSRPHDPDRRSNRREVDERTADGDIVDHGIEPCRCVPTACACLDTPHTRSVRNSRSLPWWARRYYPHPTRMVGQFGNEPQPQLQRHSRRHGLNIGMEKMVVIEGRFIYPVMKKFPLK